MKEEEEEDEKEEEEGEREEGEGEREGEEEEEEGGGGEKVMCVEHTLIKVYLDNLKAQVTEEKSLYCCLFQN